MRPAEHYTFAAAVVVPGRVAAVLLARAGLRDYVRTRRGEDPETDQVLVAMSMAAAYWREQRASASGSDATPIAEAGPSSPGMSTTAAAGALGCTPRAVRQAIGDGRLPAQRVGGRWLISPDDVEHLRASRAA